MLWYRDDQPVDESNRCHFGKEDKGVLYLDVLNLEILDQAEWKCVAMNDYGHSVTSCFLKLIIPRHYKKPRFLENLQAILSDEGAVNLECKVIGVPQPVLKWYKDGEELKPGDIHRIISGQDGTCCLGTYTCEAQNCMGIAASSASLLGFEDSMKAKAKKKTEIEPPLERNLSLSTIHEERTSQMYDTPIGDITLDEKGEISFSFDGKEVSVSLYETPDLTEEEALQIVEMYADQLSENITEHNVVELPPLRFVKETSTSGNLLMEAIIIDVSPDYFVSPEEDLRTEADVEELSIADENGPPQLSLDQDISGEDYLEKTMALLSEEKADLPKKMPRKKSDSQKSGEDFFSLSREQSLSEKRDDDTQIMSESELASFASARSSAKQKSKALKPSSDEGNESSDNVNKTILVKDEITASLDQEVPVAKPRRERRSSRGSRRSSSGSDKSINKPILEERKQEELPSPHSLVIDEDFKQKIIKVSDSLAKIMNNVQIIERDIILKSELMSSAATASRSLEIINSLISPLSEIHSITDAIKESALETVQISPTLLNILPQPLKYLQQSLTMIEKCIEVESESKTLVKKTCISFIETCCDEMQNIIIEIGDIFKSQNVVEERIVTEIDILTKDLITVLKLSEDTIKTKNLLSEANEITKIDEVTFETKHLRDTQKALFELKSPLNSLLCIVDSAESKKLTDFTKINSSEVIINDMSASVQDLQMALEQIETLSVKESTTPLKKYNTEIIETVMDSVLKLRNSFEQLTIESQKDEQVAAVKEALTSIKLNLSQISHHINTLETNVGTFDILQSENKLEVLQKIAQILIALENNLPRLESLPEMKSHLDIFHKNLTKVLENVIESNESKKYFALLEICDAVNRIINSIKLFDSENILSLASLCNTLQIIHGMFVRNIFESELNCSILNNIADTLINVKQAINTTQDVSLYIDSEHIQERKDDIQQLIKANTVIEYISQAIASINNITSLETIQEFKQAITPTLENIEPILIELKKNIASTTPCIDQEDHISEVSDLSFVQTLATPIYELNQNIVTLNQIIVENLDNIKENSEISTKFAEPLHKLHHTLEIIQQDVLSQYGEDVTAYEVNANMANAVYNLQSCILIINENAGVEAADEMSTLEDISGIKTTAETIPEDYLVLPQAKEALINEALDTFNKEYVSTATAQVLHTLNEHLDVIQNPEVLEALDTLSEVSDYTSLKSIHMVLGDLHIGLEEILQPLPMDSSSDLKNLINTSKLISIAEPMQELQQSLSILHIENIPIYENILEMSTEKVHSILHNISEFKEYLNKCIQAVFPAMETADKTIEISNKVECLREVCEHLKDILRTTKALSVATSPQYNIIVSIEDKLDNLLNATDVTKSIKIDDVKHITEDLYQKIISVQEELIHFAPQTAHKLAQEVKLVQTIDELEKNIAVLEQYDFVDLSKLSEATSCISSEQAIEIESDSLVQIDNIVDNAVKILQDTNISKETPIADLMILEDFFKNCRNEFGIIRCLIMRTLTHKKMIRLLQESISLNEEIENFKSKRHEITLSEDIDSSLTNFLSQIDGNLHNIKKSLMKIITTQSDVLFEVPLIKINETCVKLSNISKTSSLYEFVMKFNDVLQEAFIKLNDTQSTTILALNTSTVGLPIFDKEISEKIDEFVIMAEQISASTHIDDTSKILLSEVLLCINKHNDFRDATNVGKRLIVLKCLSECSDIMRKHLLEEKMPVIEKQEIISQDTKKICLKSILSEMLEPLHAFHSQLKIVQNQILTDGDDESISIDLSSTESFMQTMTEIQKEISKVEQLIVTEGVTPDLNNEDISLIIELDKEIHIIQETVCSMEDNPLINLIKEASKPIEEIEKSLHSILATDQTIECEQKLITGKLKLYNI